MTTALTADLRGYMAKEAAPAPEKTPATRAERLRERLDKSRKG